MSDTYTQNIGVTQKKKKVLHDLLVALKSYDLHTSTTYIARPTLT